MFYIIVLFLFTLIIIGHSEQVLVYNDDGFTILGTKDDC
jgi:hypothetical protein